MKRSEQPKITIARALREQMIEEKAKRAWAGDPDLMIGAYLRTAGRRQHPLDRIKAVLDAARTSPLFEQKGYIRACDSSGRREILHPAFVLVDPPATAPSVTVAEAAAAAIAAAAIAAADEAA